MSWREGNSNDRVGNAMRKLLWARPYLLYIKKMEFDFIRGCSDWRRWILGESY